MLWKPTANYFNKAWTLIEKVDMNGNHQCRANKRPNTKEEIPIAMSNIGPIDCPMMGTMSCLEKGSTGKNYPDSSQTIELASLQMLSWKNGGA